MPAKIQSLSIINFENSLTYMIGETYNDLLLHRIEVRESTPIMYVGYTKEREVVFEAINLPILIEYVPN